MTAWEVACGHSTENCTVSCPQPRIEPGESSQAMGIYCLPCYEELGLSEFTMRLAWKPLHSENTCQFCGKSPARYSTNLMFSVCDGCRGEQINAFLSLSFLKRQAAKDPPSAVFNDIVFLGSLDAATDSEMLERLSITNILVCGNNLKMRFKNNSRFRYHLLPIDDSLDQNLLIYLPLALLFIDDAVQRGEHVLIHCHAGISRSAAVAIAWLMKRHGWSFNATQSFVKSCRQVIHPNANFVKTLQEQWEPTLQFDTDAKGAVSNTIADRTAT